MIYSNYLLQKLKNKRQLIRTAYNNLKEGGWFFIHTFDKSDSTSNCNSDITRDFLEEMLEKQGFKNVEIKKLDYFDREKGHNHWHKILEAVSQK